MTHNITIYLKCGSNRIGSITGRGGHEGQGAPYFSRSFVSTYRAVSGVRARAVDHGALRACSVYYVAPLMYVLRDNIHCDPPKANHPWQILLIFFDSTYYTSERFGEGTGPIFVDYINCTGWEPRIYGRCSYFSHYYGCSHNNNVGVHRQPGQ